jgi:hypothetical protein
MITQYSYFDKITTSLLTCYTMGTPAVPLLLIILILTMVTSVTQLCDCNKCGEWIHAQIHGGAIIKSQEQWETNPRFYACEHIIGDIHNEESYARTNNNNIILGLGYSAVFSPDSRENNNVVPPPPMRPTGGCTRVAVAHDVDISSSEDEELTFPLASAKIHHCRTHC